jgi:N1-aminopropylagmatine ureohydrolase
MTADSAGSARPFFDLPPEDCDLPKAAAVLVPVPYDLTCSWRAGAARGPEAIHEASLHVELYDIETDSQPHRRGIASIDPIVHHGGPEALAEIVASRVGSILDRRQIPIVLGGEHSVTIGAVQATAARHPDLTVLQIDAHGDTRESYEGSTHNHACVMARARQCAKIVQVGIRSLDASELPQLDRSRVFFAHDIAGKVDRAWIDRVVDRLTEDVYVTIDLDGFDPAVLPATGTPEPGGLSWPEVTALLDAVARRCRIVAFDVVELCPDESHPASDFIAAKLIYRLLAMIFARRSAPSEQAQAPR